MRRRTVFIAASLLAGVTLPAAPGARAADNAVHTANMSHVANVTWPITPYPQDDSFGLVENNRLGGTDLETVTITLAADPDGDGPATAGPRDFAVAGTYHNGLQLIDVTDPESPVLAQSFECGNYQGDVQIIRRDGRVYAAYTQEDNDTHQYYDTLCLRQAFALAGYNLPPTLGDAETIPDRFGTLIIDITNPYATTGPDAVKVVGWARWKMGSHNSTIDPSGRWLYNSNQDLIAKIPVNGQPLYQIEVFDLADLTNPVKVGTIPLSTGAGPHDITFSADGNRAYVAAISHTVVLDTTNKAAATVIGVIEDPAISIHHQSDPVQVGDKRFLIVSDELAGVAQGAAACPGGGLHVYDVTGALEATPVKVGYFAIPQVAPPGQHHMRCTAHVFKAYDNGLMTIAWYGAGVRVLDLNGLVGVSAGVSPAVGSLGTGMRELGSFYFSETTDTPLFDGSQTWAAKVHRWNPDGSAYIFASDLDRGFDVFRYDPAAGASAAAGMWLNPTEALARAGALRPAAPGSQRLPYCVIDARATT